MLHINHQTDDRYVPFLGCCNYDILCMCVCVFDFPDEQYIGYNKPSSNINHCCTYSFICKKNINLLEAHH